MKQPEIRCISYVPVLSKLQKYAVREYTAAHMKQSIQA